MPSGCDPYILIDEKNEIIELGYHDWYEHPGYQMSHCDYCNTIKYYTLTYAEFLNFWHSEEAKPWLDEIKTKLSDRCDLAKPWIDKACLLEQIRKDISAITPSDNQSWDKKYKNKLSIILEKIVSDIDNSNVFKSVVWK